MVNRLFLEGLAVDPLLPFVVFDQSVFNRAASILNFPDRIEKSTGMPGRDTAMTLMTVVRGATSCDVRHEFAEFTNLRYFWHHTSEFSTIDRQGVKIGSMQTNPRMYNVW